MYSSLPSFLQFHLWYILIIRIIFQYIVMSTNNFLAPTPFLNNLFFLKYLKLHFYHLFNYFICNSWVYLRTFCLVKNETVALTNFAQWLDTGLWTGGSWVQFLPGACTSVADWGTRRRQPVNVSPNLAIFKATQWETKYKTKFFKVIFLGNLKK